MLYYKGNKNVAANVIILFIYSHVASFILMMMKHLKHKKHRKIKANVANNYSVQELYLFRKTSVETFI